MKAYITSVQPLLINDRICFDLFFVTSEDDSWKCLRIYNYYLSFIVARFPGMSIDRFVSVLRPCIEDSKVIKHRKLRDSAYYQFDNNYDYFEIINPSPIVLKRVHLALTEQAKQYYKTIDPAKLEPYDYLFWKNTEQPFRFVATTTSLSQTPYNLSCRYNIPLIGGVNIDISKLSKAPEDADYLPSNFVKIDPQHMFYLNANKGLDYIRVTVKTLFNNDLRAIIKDDSVDFFNHITVMSFDIETYNRYNDDLKLIDINAQDVQEIAKNNDCCEIMCIGIGLFHLNDPKPFQRYCLITKSIDPKDKFITSHKLKIYRDYDLFDREVWTVEDEYGKNSGSTHYIICKGRDELKHILKSIDHNRKLTYFDRNIISNFIPYGNEADLLSCFIDIINMYHPQIITAFNNYGFDDRYIYQRILNYSLSNIDLMKLRAKSRKNYAPVFTGTLLNKYISALSPYPILYKDTKICKFQANPDENIDEAEFRYHPTTISIPFWKEFSLKIDNEAYHDQRTMYTPHVIITDVYKIMLKEDAKRFTQNGYGNLKTMLAVYDIKNPFNNEPLSKTDMPIEHMFDLWEQNKSIYEIGLYCAQDAWICGTLIIKRNKFIDLIEMATMSNTSFRDSVYRADGIRVSNCILRYGYANGFAVMDNTLEERARKIESTLASDEVLKKKKDGYENISKTKKEVDVRPMGNKQFDTRTIVGGQVRQIKAGREFAVVASDYSSMYPSNKEASNVDSSSRVDMDIINNFEKYGLKLVKSVEINDMYAMGNNKVKLDSTEDDLEYLVKPRFILYVKHE